MSFVGVQVRSEGEGTIVVDGGLRTEQIGDLAASHSITLHELSLRTASLEDAFLEATGGAVEYGAPGTAGRREVG
jgi:ABC-2 type transport system ATP-binding protein